jgi:serine/threonine-protein kinase
VATTILKGGRIPNGASWGTGDVIVFGDDLSGRLMRVSADGGPPVPVTAEPAVGHQHVTPFLLPDARRVLFSDVSTLDASDAQLMVQSLDGGDARLVVPGASDGRLLPSGRLAFMRLGNLMTVGFDVARGTATGAPVAALSGVLQKGLTALTNTFPGAGMFAVSNLGTLAVVRGGLIGSDPTTLIWTTRDGRTSSAEPASGAPAGGSRIYSRIAPDGSRAIVLMQTPLRRQWSIADWRRDVWTVCGDCNAENTGAEWAPDGRRVLLGRANGLVAHALDGSAPDQVLVAETGRSLIPGAWLADGRIVYVSRQAADVSNAEIKVLGPGDREGRVVVQMGIGGDPAISPDGRWMAYRTGERGRDVFVEAFPGPGARTQVSVGGGDNPSWSADGRTLYYLSDRAVVAVDIRASGAQLIAGTPHELFRSARFQTCTNRRCYDISPDGSRFLFRDYGTAPRVSATRMEVVLNWTATLPTGR